MYLQRTNLIGPAQNGYLSAIQSTSPTYSQGGSSGVSEQSQDTDWGDIWSNVSDAYDMYSDITGNDLSSMFGGGESGAASSSGFTSSGQLGSFSTSGVSSAPAFSFGGSTSSLSGFGVGGSTAYTSATTGAAATGSFTTGGSGAAFSMPSSIGSITGSGGGLVAGGSSTAAGGAASGGASGAASGGGALAGAGWWALLAAAIYGNESEARDAGRRSDDTGSYIWDLAIGNVGYDDAEYYVDKIFGSDLDNDYLGLGGDTKVATNLLSWDFSNAWDHFKDDSSFSKILDLF